MKLARWAVVICALLPRSAAIAQDPVIRVNVRLVRALVTVKDANGGLVGSLKRDEFSVFDNGVKQDIAVFEHHTDQPLSISVLFDTSASVGIALKYETDSATRFLNAVLREGNTADELALYSFNWEVRVQSGGFTRRVERLERALHAMRAEGGTSLYDAIYLASQEMEGRDGRHVIIVVTDGGDTTSYKDFHAALEGAQRADAVIYPILVMPIKNDAGRNIGGENALQTLASSTGGIVFKPNLGPALDDAFTDILSALRTQYLIGYYPQHQVPGTDFHRVMVTIPRAAANEFNIRNKAGYYADSPLRKN